MSFVYINKPLELMNTVTVLCVLGIKLKKKYPDTEMA